MDTPIFSTKQYLSSTSFSTNAQAVTLAINEMMLGLFGSGLANVQQNTVTFSGMTVNIQFSPLFSLIGSAGQICHAHGVTNNADTQSYSVNLASLVPGSGSITAYIYLTPFTIQMAPYTVIGPPIGHPDYDPTFVPYTAYAYLRDSFALAAGTSVPAGAFQYAQMTLTAGQSSITSLNQSGILQSSGYSAGFITRSVSLTANYSAGEGDIGAYFSLAATNVVLTLPNPTTLNATNPSPSFGIIATASGTSVTLAGGTFIGGAQTGNTTVSLNTNDFLLAQSDGTNYRVVSGSPAIMQSPHGMAKFLANGNWVCPAGIFQAEFDVWGGGGGGGSSTAADAAGSGAGGGGYASGIFNVVPGTSYAIIVGANGVGATGAANGTAGGTSSVASLGIQATGGGGGYYSAGGGQYVVGTDGVGSGGTVNLTGATGSSGFLNGVFVLGGAGGGAFCASGGPPTPVSGGAGLTPGGGGAGGANNNPGGGGGQGLVIVRY